MKKIITFIILIVCTLYYYNNGISAYEINSPLIQAYNNFLIKLETKIESKENQLVILEKVKTKIETILKTKKISTKSLILLSGLNDLNNNQIKKVKSKIDNSYYTNLLRIELVKKETPEEISTEIINFNNIDSKQTELEIKERQKFIDYENNTSLPSYILNLLSSNIKYIYSIEDNENYVFEFLEDNKIKKLIFTRYYEITLDNYNLFNSKNGIILNYNGKYIFIENYEKEDKIPYSESYSLFKGVIINNFTYYKKNSDYYNYNFQNYNYIKDSYGFYLKNLNTLGFNPKETILSKNGDTYIFIDKFTEYKLINQDIIQNISNKNLFISHIIDDKKNITYDTDKYFLELKSITEKMTNGLTKDEKIKTIYKYILENINYSNPVILSKKEIFSGIDTYKNKDGVCEGYVKLMVYMLMFAGIEDVEVIRGFVLNAPDFPKVGHAWVKVGDYYYDPTFDDPIGNTKTKLFDEHIYYKLPYDLFYTNRYNIADLPEEIKIKSQNELDLIINKNLFNLVAKYKDSGYNLMKYTLMLSNNGLNYNDIINISTLKNIITTYDINGSDMSFYKNGVKIYIRRFKYYKLEENNIQNVLITINYDLNNKYIFKWDLGNGTYEYRLVYELELN